MFTDKLSKTVALYENLLTWVLGGRGEGVNEEFHPAKSGYLSTSLERFIHVT